MRIARILIGLVAALPAIAQTIKPLAETQLHAAAVSPLLADPRNLAIYRADTQNFWLQLDWTI